MLFSVTCETFKIYHALFPRDGKSEDHFQGQGSAGEPQDAQRWASYCPRLSISIVSSESFRAKSNERSSVLSYHSCTSRKNVVQEYIQPKVVGQFTKIVRFFCRQNHFEKLQAGVCVKLKRKPFFRKTATKVRKPTISVE